VEEKICVLDTGTASGGKGDSEGQVGCTECDTGFGPLGDNEHEERPGWTVELEQTTYFVDTTRITQWEYTPFYERDVQDVLGQQENPPDSGPDTNTDTRHCFNCGSPSHTLSECPSPRNHALISLSRQLFTFHQQLRQSAHRQALGDFERIHVVEGKRQEKLDWLNWFEPGEVRGALLRDAIGLNEDGDDGGEGAGEWLRNMAVWGYPKGWTGERDPRYEVMRRIEGELSDEDEEEDEEDAFVIFGDTGEEEITLASPPKLYSDTIPRPKTTDEDPPLPKIYRWVSYPNTHFSSALLPIYTGYALPPLPTTPSPTFANDRQTLWDQITSGNLIRPPPPPPRPPSTSPPPLPPPQDEQPAAVHDLDGEAEMDLSDSD
jgi:zinc finger CCHC domain-containing protein 8